MSLLAVGDPVTLILSVAEQNFAYGAVQAIIPSGYRVEILGRRTAINRTTEGITWLRGHHAIETSSELRCLLAERLLLS